MPKPIIKPHKLRDKGKQKRNFFSGFFCLAIIACVSVWILCGIDNFLVQGVTTRIFFVFRSI